jgi:transposase
MSCSKLVSRFEILAADEPDRRRRHWSDAEKVRIVEESLRGHRQGSAVARRYGISRGLLTQWRKAHRLGLLDGSPSPFTPVQIAPDPMPPADMDVRGPPSHRVEITLGNGRRLSVGLSIDGTTLARLIRVLEQA